MKTIIIGLIALFCLIIFTFSCNDKPEPKPATANINDILGTWVSIDSTLIGKDGKYFYVRDYLNVSKNTIVNGVNYTIFIISSGIKWAYYSGIYFGADSLILSYTGPSFINIPHNHFRNKVLFNLTRDTIKIIDFRTTYPTSSFNVFCKIK